MSEKMDREAIPMRYPFAGGHSIGDSLLFFQEENIDALVLQPLGNAQTGDACSNDKHRHRVWKGADFCSGWSQILVFLSTGIMPKCSLSVWSISSV